MLHNSFARAEFAVTLLSSGAYTWYTTQDYAMGTGHANRLAWGSLKSDLQSYFKPPNYAYYIQIALSFCKQLGNVASYIHIFLQHLNRYSDMEEQRQYFVLSKG